MKLLNEDNILLMDDLIYAQGLALKMFLDDFTQKFGKPTGNEKYNTKALSKAYYHGRLKGLMEAMQMLEYTKEGLMKKDEEDKEENNKGAI